MQVQVISEVVVIATCSDPISWVLVEWNFIVLNNSTVKKKYYLIDCYTFNLTQKPTSYLFALSFSVCGI